jgi:ATP-dependent DNA helicase DinG
MNDSAPQTAAEVATASTRVLTEALKADIRAAYASLQANTPGFSTRRAQSHMIGVVSRALATSGGVGIAEAPTGVGKSLAYLTAGVPIALATGKKLVISTGTVALQAQLVGRDIPAFLAATGLEARVALAKGRTRYLCTRDAAELQGGSSQDAMFPDQEPLYDSPLGPLEIEAANGLLDAYTDRLWDGDLDAAPEVVSPALRSRITTPASSCSGRRCSFAAQCPVLTARTTVRDAQVVVTNHALLLSSLALGDADNSQPLLAAPADMLLVLDEGHHVAGVAIDQGAARLPMGEMAKRTGRMQTLIASAYRLADKEQIGSLLPNEAVDLAARVSKALKAFRVELEHAWTPEPGDRDPMWRAPHGKLPADWMPAIDELGDDTHSLFNW